MGVGKKLLYRGLFEPGRQGLFWAYRILRKLSAISEKIHRRYTRLLRLAPFYDAFYIETGLSDQVQRYYAHLKGQIPYYKSRPKISILMPIYKVDLGHLREALASIALQIYPEWELCAVDDNSGDPQIDNLLSSFQEQHPGKVHYKKRQTNGHISQSSQDCLDLATGHYIALLDHDDRLYPNALVEMVRYINSNENPEILYSDERVFRRNYFDSSGPLFKPDWSPFLHLAVNYTTHLSVYKRSLVEGIGGFRQGFEGAQDHDLMLRASAATKSPIVHVPFCLYQWRGHQQSTAGNLSAKPYAAEAGIKAVTEHCHQHLGQVEVGVDKLTLHYHVKFKLPTKVPKVSVVIPSKNAYPYIRRCLTTLFENTEYPEFEVVVVDNGTSDEACLDLFRRFKTNYGNRFSMLSDDRSFNFAALCNAGVNASQGDVVVLLNNDTEIIDTGWLEELVSLAVLTPVGAVGAKLLFPDNNIQHAGVTLMDREIAHHAFKFLASDAPSYLNLLNTRHEVSAVTGACLAVSRKSYENVGGLDEVFLPNGFGDVDFCLKLQELGLHNLYTPHATLIHHESKSRGENIEVFEKHRMMRRWGAQLILDPYRNPNLLPHPNFIDDTTAIYPELSLGEFDKWLSTYKFMV